MQTLHARTALLAAGWQQDVRITIHESGKIHSIDAGRACDPCDEAVDTVIPGIPNGHSHAFQRMIAGRTEHLNQSAEDFWTWREAMYTAAARLRPETLLPIVEMVYAEMLAAGYTSVAEFHYLHHQPDGSPYESVSRLADVHVEAAHNTGIRLTLVPTLYSGSGFGGTPVTRQQRRFHNHVDAFIDLIDAIRRCHPDLRLGIGLHSLRSVTQSDIGVALDYARAELPHAPVHIHIAEQQREVADSIAFSGCRPVEWLLEHFPINERWNLVHATHATAQELAGIAQSGATTVLCPTTEANLGDGIFPLAKYLSDGGRLAIGSDSQVTVDPLRELELLEYGQRLAERRRNVAADERHPHTGSNLLMAALAGGRSALGQNCGTLAEGAAADLIVVNTDDPRLAGAQGDLLLDALVFAAPRRPVRRVMVAGRWRVDRGRHAEHRRIFDAYRAATDTILKRS